MATYTYTEPDKNSWELCGKEWEDVLEKIPKETTLPDQIRNNFDHLMNEMLNKI